MMGGRHIRPSSGTARYLFKTWPHPYLCSPEYKDHQELKLSPASKPTLMELEDFKIYV